MKSVTMSAPKLEIRNYRSMRGQETPAYEGTLYVDGLKCASLYSAGTGGPLEIHWFTRPPFRASDAPPLPPAVRAKEERDAKAVQEAKARVEAWVASLSPIVLFEGEPHAKPYKRDVEWMINEVEAGMVAKREHAKLAKQARTHILFRLSTDGRGVYHTLKASPTDQKAMTWLRAKHPDAKLLNDDILAGKPLPEGLPQP